MFGPTPFKRPTRLPSQRIWWPESIGTCPKYPKNLKILTQQTDGDRLESNYAGPWPDLESAPGGAINYRCFWTALRFAKYLLKIIFFPAEFSKIFTESCCKNIYRIFKNIFWNIFIGTLFRFCCFQERCKRDSAATHFHPTHWRRIVASFNLSGWPFYKCQRFAVSNVRLLLI